MTKLTDVSKFTRDDVVPFYSYMILTIHNDKETKRVNDLILSKWKVSGLTYIKEKAWKMAGHLGYTFEKGWGDKTLPEAYASVQSLKNQIQAIKNRAANQTNRLKKMSKH